MLRIASRGMITSRSLLLQTFNQEFSSSTERKLEGKVALITGAASGIGKETAAKFINNGAKVVIADVQKQLGQETASKLGPNSSFVLCDVTKESDVCNAVDFTVSSHGQLDIMYNNAGITCRSPPSILDLDLSVLNHVMAVNVGGVMAGIKHAARVMIPRQRGSILCTSSIAGVMGGIAAPTYSTSKSGVIGIMRSVLPELCKNGIRINCISPFGILTPLAIEEMKVMFPDAVIDAQDSDKILHDVSVLKGAHCEAIDVANTALYLASDDAKYVSGQNLVVDGGFTTFKKVLS